MARRRQSSGRREYPRTARVNELVREIVADELERIDDPRLEMVSVTGVRVEQELSQGIVFFSTLVGEAADAEVLGAFAEHRARLQAAIARQSRMRRTPALRFAPDGGVRGGERIEEVLREIQPIPVTGEPAGDPADGDGPISSTDQRDHDGDGGDDGTRSE